MVDLVDAALAGAEAAGAPFTETLVELRQENNVSAAAHRAHSPTGLVPVLKDGELAIWDSLAICEYLAERFPRPAVAAGPGGARARRGRRRREMHAGLRLPARRMPDGPRRPGQDAELSEATHKDVRRIVASCGASCWRASAARCWAAEWSIADAFFTPVATRFRTYGVRLSDFGDGARGGLRRAPAGTAGVPRLEGGRLT